MAFPTTIQVPIAPGELIDKITILKIKQARISVVDKLKNVGHELGILESVQDEAITSSRELQTLTEELLATNEKLWEIEDEIRICERDQDFGSRFIKLARSVYHTNDVRAALKRQINELLGSNLVEEKHYVNYQDAEE